MTTPWTRIGTLEKYDLTQFGLEGDCSNARIRISILTPGLIRVQATRAKEFEDFSYAVIAEPGDVVFNCVDEKDHLLLTTDALKVVIKRNPLAITFENPGGQVINQDEDDFGISWINSEVTNYKKLQEGERFVGLGEKTGNLDRRGLGYLNWNTDSFAYSKEQDPLYSTTPFYIGIHHDLCYGIFFDNTNKSHFNFGASNTRFSSFMAEDGDLDYYFLFGNSVPEILKLYSYLTGTTPLPPIWSLGYQQSRYSYLSQTEVKRIAQTFREKEIPADVMVLDIHYMDHYKVFTWDQHHFSDPQGLVDDLEAMGFKVVVILDPGIKIEQGYGPYEEGIQKDVFLKYPDNTCYSAYVWPGLCHFPDFTKSETRDWWGGNFKELTDMGITGFWNDMNEIATWGQFMPELIQFNYDGRGGSSKKGRNVYGMLMARSTFEGTRRLLKNKRVFNLTRSAYSGIQRYAALWTGDNVASDENMLLGVRIVNNLGLTGIPFSGYDTGGFAEDSTPELFARWISIGAFSPFFRGHALVNTRSSEPWVFGEKIEEISRNYIKLRYRLMPYIYSLFFEASQTGMPINRSLAIDYPHQPLIYDQEFQNQYLFGPWILVAPVESNKEITKVYLPDEGWYDFYSGERIEANGNLVYVDCPLERLPLLVRQGSLIPMQSQTQSTMDHSNHLLQIHVYQGGHESSFVYYEDDGLSLDHENEKYYRRLIRYHDTLSQMIISPVEGSYKSKFKKIKLVFHGFPNLEEAAVNFDRHTFLDEEFVFMAPLTRFDPVKESPHEESQMTQTMQFDNTPEQIVIKW